MKKGFTLAELIGVITILGVIALITVPVVSNVVENTKNKAITTLEKSLKLSLENYKIDHIESFYESDTLTVSLSDLKKGGYVDLDIKDPTTGVCLDNDATFTIKKDGKKYEYILDKEISQMQGDDSDCNSY